MLAAAACAHAALAPCAHVPRARANEREIGEQDKEQEQESERERGSGGGRVDGAGAGVLTERGRAGAQVSVISWNVLDVLSVELFPTALRGLAMGFLSSVPPARAHAREQACALLLPPPPSALHPALPRALSDAGSKKRWVGWRHLARSSSSAP